MFFRKAKFSSPVRASSSESRQMSPMAAIAVVEHQVCDPGWLPSRSISQLVGMTLGGLRTSAIFTNTNLNEQASALSHLAQKTLPVVLHVQDNASGNNQTLRLPFFRFFAGSPQQSVDFTLIAHKLSEQTLLPIMVIHSGCSAAFRLPSTEALQNFLGKGGDQITTPTPAQRMLFGENRLRIPQFWDADIPMTSGLEVPAALRDRQWAARQTFFADHVPSILQESLRDFAERFGRLYEAAEFRHESSPHQVVTTEELPTDLSASAPLVKVNFLTPELHQKLSGMTLSFIDRNHSRALSTALNLQGFSLVHYGPIDAQAVDAALALDAQTPMGTARTIFLHQSVGSPKEDLYNQQVLDGYPDVPRHAPDAGPLPNYPLTASSALENHPVLTEPPLADLHAYWAQNGKYFAYGLFERVIATPTLAAGVLPAGSGHMLPQDTEYVANRIVLAADVVNTLISRMQRENYATDLLDSVSRSWASAISMRLQAKVKFSDLAAEAFTQVLHDFPGDKEALRHQGYNAMNFLPETCFLEEPWVGHGGIR
ncbi:MAG TPA: hypothetical protein VLM37_05795, partial [Fibrobacteraceae bacterium]|nr:hypothetical protein [Fibrobacteraceae bacterium]